MKIIAQNKKAFHDYHILEHIEAGIVLRGDEVKSIRAGHVSLIGSYATIHSGELFLINCTIAPYAQACDKRDEKEKTRSRKLLLRRKQIMSLVGDISRKGITIVALKIYLNDKNLIKVELGLCKHKSSSDKKQTLKERDIAKETARTLKQYI